MDSEVNRHEVIVWDKNGMLRSVFVRGAEGNVFLLKHALERLGNTVAGYKSWIYGSGNNTFWGGRNKEARNDRKH